MPIKSIPVPVPLGHKYCFTCQTVQPRTHFHKRSGSDDGLTTVCKSCRRRKRVAKRAAAEAARVIAKAG